MRAGAEPHVRGLVGGDDGGEEARAVTGDLGIAENRVNSSGGPRDRIGRGLLTRGIPSKAIQHPGRSGRGGLSLARLACCALLPSVALAGFASAAAAAGAGAGTAALSPLLTNRWYAALGFKVVLVFLCSSLEMHAISQSTSHVCSVYTPPPPAQIGKWAVYAKH